MPGAHPPGAIVIGLGEVGDLTPEKLARLVANAAVRHAVRVADTSSGVGWASAAMSTLFIGTDSGSMTVADSIRSIVRGVLEANRRLRATKLWERVRIDRLQFVELFEDVAEQAAHIVNALPEMLAQELSRAEAVKPTPQLGVMPGGEYSRPPEDHRAQGWWRRVQITGQTSPASPASGGNGAEAIELVYTPLTDRAKLSQSTAVQSLAQVVAARRSLDAAVDRRPEAVERAVRAAAAGEPEELDSPRRRRPAAAQSRGGALSVRADGGSGEHRRARCR